MSTISTRLTTSGNSKAIRLPKALLALSQIGDAVELEARPGEIVIRSAKSPRAGWREQIEKVSAELGDTADEFSGWNAIAADGFDDIPWNGPTYEEWVKRGKT